MVSINMNYDISEKEKDAIYAELKSEYIYIVLPFILLVGIKLYSSTWHEIFLAPDWSLASCIIFGQITARVSKAVANTKLKTSEAHFGLYTAKRFVLVVLALVCYIFMMIKPSLELGIIQTLIFLLASRFHFSDGFTTKLLQQVRVTSKSK